MAEFSPKRAKSRIYSLLRRKAEEPSDPPQTLAALAACRNEEAFRLNANIGAIPNQPEPRRRERPSEEIEEAPDPLPWSVRDVGADEQSPELNRPREHSTASLAPPGKGQAAEERRSPYTPLDPARTEIRVLDIQAGRAPAPLCCELRTVSLAADPKPAYESISYCWGAQSGTGEILLNGVATRVPLSAKAVLERMRQPDRARVVWIDAICINQEDTEERGSQVGLMSEVYSHPTMNLIWLGEDEGDTDQVLALVDQIVKNAGEETDGFRTFETTANSPSPTTGRILDLPPDISPLLRFYQRRWFERVWCVQEAALAPDSMCHCGSYELPLVDVMRAAQWLSYKRFLVTCDVKDSKGIHNIISLSPMMDLGRQGPRTTQRRKTALYWLLRRLQNFDATDPRDHVFGILGMYMKFRGTKTIPDLLAPDYNKTVAEVFRDATRFAIQMIPSDLPVFSYINPDPPPDQGAERVGWFPSWVPQWHSSPIETQHPRDLPALYKCHDDVWVHQMKEAAADPDVLSLRGIAVDGVLSTSAVIQSRGQLLYDAPQVAGQSRGWRIGRTLIAGVNVQGQPASESEAMDYCRPWAEHFLGHHEPPKHSSLLQDLHGATGEPGEDLARAARWDEASLVAVGRRFFRTHTGFLGIGPRSMARGDIIAIIYGCRWPVVLRPCVAGWAENVPDVPGQFDYHLDPQPEGYRILGVGYVDGIMFGEYVREYREQKRKDMVFELR